MIEAGGARPAGTTVFDWPEFAWLTWDEVEEGEALVDELRRAGLEVWLIRPAQPDFTRGSALRVRDPGRVPRITTLGGPTRRVDDDPLGRAQHANCRCTIIPDMSEFIDAIPFAYLPVFRETMDGIMRISAT